MCNLVLVLALAQSHTSGAAASSPSAHPSNGDDALLIPWKIEGVAHRKVPRQSLAAASFAELGIGHAGAAQSYKGSLLVAEPPTDERRRMMENVGRVEEQLWELQAREGQELQAVRAIQAQAAHSEELAVSALFYLRVTVGASVILLLGLMAWAALYRFEWLAVSRICTSVWCQTTSSPFRIGEYTAHLKMPPLHVDDLEDGTEAEQRNFPIATDEHDANAVQGQPSAGCEYYCLDEGTIEAAPQAEHQETTAIVVDEVTSSAGVGETRGMAEDEWWETPKVSPGACAMEGCSRSKT